MAIATQHLSAIGDSLVQCRFAMEAGLGQVINDEYGHLLGAVTGWDPGTAELTEIGERIVNMERIFNVREVSAVKTIPFPTRSCPKRSREDRTKVTGSPLKDCTACLTAIMRQEAGTETVCPERKGSNVWS